VTLRAVLRGWLHRRGALVLTDRRVVHGISALVINSRPDIDTEQVFARLDGALSLIRQYVPRHYRRFRRDFSAFLVERRAYRGSFDPNTRVCMVELTFVVNPAFSLAQVAATILHESMHARLFARGVALDDSPAQERFCRHAEVEFGRLVPDGAAVIQRALGSLQLTDEDIAPSIDPRVAAHRVAQVDAQARTGGPIQ
jgi:hypothetical protein